MALTRNPIISRYQMLKAYTLRQRPIDLERRLRADATNAHATKPPSPLSAWEVYKGFPRVKCFADCGWLVRYGVYSYTGEEAFHSSLVRQLNGLETWNDEFYQVELSMLHPPTPALVALESWNHWSFDHPSLSDFFTACESHPGVMQMLAHRSTKWKLKVNLDET